MSKRARREERNTRSAFIIRPQKKNNNHKNGKIKAKFETWLREREREREIEGGGERMTDLKMFFKLQENLNKNMLYPHINRADGAQANE